MKDHFLTLIEPRRPWIDLEKLKSRFHEFSNQLHPDRFHQAEEIERAAAGKKFSEINTAYTCLREPKDRLVHLLELELGQKPRDIQRIPPGTMDLFVEIGETCRDIDAYSAKKTETTSPMLRLRLLQENLLWTDRLLNLQTTINAKRDEFLYELKPMNLAWESAPIVGDPLRSGVLPLERLEQLYRGLSYVGRWSEQIQERITHLAA